MTGDGRADGATSELYERLWPRLVRLGRLLTGSQSAGEDVAQEAFLRFLRQDRDVDNPEAYLRRSVVNLAVNTHRRERRERDLLQRYERPDPVVRDAPPDALWPLVIRLPARQRAVLVLRYYEDLPEREIAQLVGCRPGTVKSLASRALATLRKDLAS
jgi:RNA polymerase sigma-70 factor (sigma-E family)